MVTIKIKPISVNEAYTGRRFSTDKLKGFKRQLSFTLPNITIPEGDLKMSIVFGFSSKGSDLDNHTKAFLDCLQKKHGFNDNRVYDMHLRKEIVSKGNEFIKYKIEKMN